eukprot:snap_masked-scaffold_21-processed-gene-3.22-mRNA-1 protein AED:1.00 eAED:1.00 QI:0/0/0/0/1/1/2/0/233
MNLDLQNYTVDFVNFKFSSCIDLSGETGLPLYENEICTVQDTYQAFLEIFLYGETNYFPLPFTCIPPYLLELTGLNFTLAKSISFQIEYAVIFSAEAFLSQNGETVFPNVEEIFVTEITAPVLENSFFGSKNFPRLSRVLLAEVYVPSFPVDLFDGNEENIIGFAMGVNSIHASSLSELSLSNNPIEFVADDAFRNCSNLTVLRMTGHLLSETAEEFTERTGFCEEGECTFNF